MFRNFTYCVIHGENSIKRGIGGTIYKDVTIKLRIFKYILNVFSDSICLHTKNKDPRAKTAIGTVPVQRKVRKFKFEETFFTKKLFDNI